MTKTENGVAIERLLEYTELTKEDLKIAVEKDKSVAEAAKSFKGLWAWSEILDYIRIT